MARKKMHIDSDHGDGIGHDRPWVFFMIDCFFLITQFFVITFSVKADEVILPQRLPPGGTRPSPTTTIDDKQPLPIHVSMNGTAADYNIQQTRHVSISELNDTLARSVGPGREYLVRVSYEPEVPWEHVIAVFNACSKVKIECGLIPLRTADH